MRRALFYAACSVAISLTFFMGLYSIAKKDPAFWAILIGMNLALWSSYPRYRSAALRTITITLTLVVLANPAISLALDALSPRSEEMPRMTPHTVLRIDMVEGALPGLSGQRRFSVDGRGFRTNTPIDYARKPAGALRIAGFGASTMEEGFIDDSRTWTALMAQQLEARLGRKVEMINTAFAGLRAEHNYRGLVESREYGPDVAIFLMGINDWNRAILEQFKSAHPPRRPGLLTPLGVLSVDRTILFRAIQIVRVAAISQLDRWGMDPPIFNEDGAELRAQNDSLSRPIRMDFRPETVSDDYADWVSKIMLECKSRHIACVFVDQPTAFQPAITPELRKRLWMTPFNAPYTLSFEDMGHVAQVYNAWLGRRAREEGFRFCSIASQVPPTTDYFIDDCHYNDNGSRTVARLVGECLADLK